MRTVVVFDTKFGNTARIAEAIARGVGTNGAVQVLDAVAARSLTERPDLLLIGGPTQNHGASVGLRSLLDALPTSLRGVPAASFDTRYRGAKLLMGSAADETAKRVKKTGSRLIVPPESFYIARSGKLERQGLEAGELERAESWGRAVATAASMAAGASS